MRYFITMITLFFSLTAAQSAEPLTPAMIRSIVSIQAYDNERGLPLPQWGTGNIISSNGYILTNFHVAADDYNTPFEYFIIAVTDPNDVSLAPTNTYWARFVGGVAQTDLALLEIVETINGDPLPESFTPLELGDASNLFLGDTLRVIGYPGVGGDTITFTTGSFSGWLGENLDHEGRRWIKTDSKISGGNSGGTALDNNNLLIGIPTAVYNSSQDGEFQAYLRPINLAFPLLKRFESKLEGVLLPSTIVDVHGQPFPELTNGRENRLEGESLALAPEDVTPRQPLQTVNARHPMQVIQLNQIIDSTIIGSDVDEDSSYHDYIFIVPRDFSERLFIYVDGQLRDADLALRFDEEIRDMDKTDYLDISDDLNSLIILEPDELEDVRQIYLRVINYFRTPLPYSVRVTTDPFTTVERDNIHSTSNIVGFVTLEDTYIATIDAAGQGDILYHTYGLLVSEDVPSFTVRVSSDNDIDLAVNKDTPITDYYGADFFDDEESIEAEYRVDNPRSGLYYVDVVNFLDQESQYTIEFNLNDAPLAENAGVVGTDGELGFIDSIALGEEIQGRLRGYDDSAGYHVYTVEVPSGVERLEVDLSATGDLDLALNFGSELPDYTLPEDGGEMDGYDFDTSNNAHVTITNPEAGTWYIEVVNLNGESPAIPYTLSANSYE